MTVVFPGNAPLVQRSCQTLKVAEIKDLCNLSGTAEKVFPSQRLSLGRILFLFYVV